MLATLVWIIILAIVAFITIRIVKNIILGVILIGLILLGYYLFTDSLPSTRSIPIIGPILPKIPTSIGSTIEVMKKFLYNVEIVETSRDSKNNLLITVTNKGKVQASNFSVYIDNKTVKITNEPKDPLNYGERTSIQTDWNKDFSEILVQTSRVNVTYSK